ncbi:hypothetical protein ACB094_01G111500 [Castanea mollissima]
MNVKGGSTILRAPRQLIATTLVGLQSVLGFIILYGGAVKKKWAVNSAFMALYAFACVLVCWAFSGKFPNATMVYFQFVFAAITLILIAGALLGRMNFYAWMFFVPLWLTFSYTIGAFTIWSNNGFLYKLGIIDYSGGFVIHLSSGVAGFYSSILVTIERKQVHTSRIDSPVGPRLTKDRERFPPNNILLMLTGAGFLWMVNVGASLAVLNTHVCTATSLLTWVMLDVYFFGKASIIGTIQGMITGLVCITPAAGVVQGWAAIIIGVCLGSIPWFTMMIIHKKSKLLQMVNDTMAVLHTHAIAGCLGGIPTGLFAEPKLNNLFFNSYGGFRQMGIQLLGILFIVKLNIVIASMICILVQFVVALRMSDEDMEIGDEAAHNEEAYAIWGQGEKLGKLRHEAAVYNDIDSSVTKSRAIALVKLK